MSEDLRGDLAHLYRRLGFDATAAELDAAESAGWDSSLAGLLNPSGSDPGVTATPPPSVPLVQVTGQAGSPCRTSEQQQLRAQGSALTQWWLSRMVAVRGANASGGTDHGTSAPVLVAGSHVRGGFYGDEPSLTKLIMGNLAVTTDFRDVYAGVLTGVLGADPEPVLGKSCAGLPLLA